MAHDANSKYYLGNEFFVYVKDASSNDKPFAYSTECTLSISANQIDTSNKQSGIWASALPGQLSWNISTGALYTTANNYSEIFDMMTTRKAVTVTFGQVTNVNEISSPIDASANAAIALATGEKHYTGTAYITSLELNAGNNEVASFTCEFTGEGELTELPA